jgi:hypothetical protein
MFDIPRFVAECEAAIATDGGREAVQEILTAAISDPAGIVAVLGKPKRAGAASLYKVDDPAHSMARVLHSDAAQSPALG